MHNNQESLDSLLYDEPHGTFHDSVLVGVQVDYVAKRLVADFDVCIGDPDADDEKSRERRRRGRLTVEGLTVWAVELPQATTATTQGGLWVGSVTRLAESSTGRALAGRIDNSLGWVFWFNDINACAYVAGAKATFTWA